MTTRDALLRRATTAMLLLVSVTAHATHGATGMDLPFGGLRDRRRRRPRRAFDIGFRGVAPDHWTGFMRVPQAPTDAFPGQTAQ